MARKVINKNIYLNDRKAQYINRSAVKYQFKDQYNWLNQPSNHLTRDTTKVNPNMIKEVKVNSLSGYHILRKRFLKDHNM